MLARLRTWLARRSAAAALARRYARAGFALRVEDLAPNRVRVELDTAGERRAYAWVLPLTTLLEIAARLERDGGG